MENNWSLDELYKSFDDPAFKDDLKEIELKLNELKKYPQLEKTEENLEDYLREQNDLSHKIERLTCYIHLIISTDTTNNEALKLDSVIDTLLASSAATRARINRWIAEFDFSDVKNEYIKEHFFILNEIKDQNKYLLDEQSELVLANMKTTGSNAWLKYKDQLVSSLTVTVDDKSYPLTEVLNMAYSKDKETRKKAYEAEIKAYPEIEQGVASALNAIKGEALTVANIRGYDSVLNRTLVDSRLSEETLNILLDTIKNSLPMFEKYYKAKAEHLGYSNGLPWYDMYAPIIDVKMDFPYEEGCDFVVEQFSTFSDNLGNYAKNAIEKKWIDVYPRKGKIGGAFCSNIHCIKESRFLLNYGNELGDVITMAHELGHGFHGHCLNDQTYLNACYPMPIAETASTFCETVVKKAALKKASKQEQLMILENEISDIAQVIVDIYSRFLFESRLIEKRKGGPLSVDEIKDLMLQAQKEAYGDGLDHNYLHPYMWTWKPHYYESDYAFYNFPYAFGLLLSKGLYGMYQKQGPSFANTYEKFLALTGKMNLEDVGKQVGIDLQDEKFWQNSIDMIKEDMNQFFDLLEQLS